MDLVSSLLSASVIGLIAWVFNTNTKVNVLDNQQKSDRNIEAIQRNDLKELINTKFDSLDEKIDTGFNAAERRLERIERKVLNGEYGK